MRRTPWVRGMVLAAVGLAVVTFGFQLPLMGSQPTGVVASTSVGGAFGGGKEEPTEPPKVVHVAAPPMSLEATRVWLKLQGKVSMNFPNDTPLEDVKRYIEQSTQDAKGGFPTGIPIYVDPQALQDADKTMASTVTMNLEGMPLATTLELLLKQLSLAYDIQKDGLLVITTLDEKKAQDGPTRTLDELVALKEEIRALRREVAMLRPQGAAEKSREAAKAAPAK